MSFDDLLTAYDCGRITRRHLLSVLAMLGAGRVSSPASLEAQSASALGTRARVINHINIQVSNVRRSAAFYQKLGLPSKLRPILPPPGQAAFAMDFANGAFLSLIQTTEKDRIGTIDHFCIGLDNFDATRDAETLRAAGLQVPKGGGDQTSFIIRDPDGISVQLADVKQTFACPSGIGNPPCDVVPLP